MRLLLQVSLHLIHNGVPCLLVLWCFQRATPLTVVDRSPRPTGSFLRVRGWRRAVARAPSRKLRWHWLLSCVGGRTLLIAKQQRPLSAAPSPSQAAYLHHQSVCFHYSYFMWYHGMKESYFLHGGGQVTAGSQVARLTTSWGGVEGGCLFWIQSIKTVCTNRKGIFPLRCNAQSSVVIHNMYIHTSDEKTSVYKTKGKIVPFYIIAYNVIMKKKSLPN